MSMILDGSNGVTFNDSSLQGAAASPYVLKNRIINGDMRIDQRNAGASVTPTSDGTYVLDRWECALSQASKYSVQQQTSVVPTGYTYATKITSLSSYSLSASDYFIYTQKIEGFNIADLAWGTANAKTVTLSFQVYSSLTGTFGGAIHNSAANRSYPFSYTISSANTWTTISITIPGDTSGTWLTTNGIGMWVRFGLGVGSTYSATAGSWSSNLYVSATGATSVVGTNGATWYITGVQLEIGTSATPFERRLYNQELANCQRYFCLLAGGGACGVAELSNRVSLTYQYPVPMRASPTGTLDATKGTLNQPQGGPNVVTTMNNFFFGTATSETGGWIVLDTSTSPFTAGRVIINAGTTGMIKFSAEL
jgi:hypothetical protein